MSALGSLVVKLALEYAQYTGGLDKSEQATLASLKRIQGAADQFSNKIGDSLKTGLGALAAFFTAGAIVGQVRAVVDELDRISDVAAAIGLTTQSLAELGYAANQSGTDAQTLEGAMGKLNLKISDAVGGNKEAVKLFRELGVQLKDTNGQVRSTDAVLADLSETFKLLPEGPTKSALAVELFGKSGAGLLQFLSQGSDGIAELRKEFVALSGGSIEEAARLAGAFNDQLGKLGVIADALGARLATKMLPGLTQITEAMTEAAKEGGILLTVYRGLAEFASIAFGTDQLGKAMSGAKDAQAELLRLSNLMAGVENTLAREPENPVAQRRLASLRSQIEGTQQAAATASQAIKDLMSAGTPTSDAKENFRKGERAAGSKAAAEASAAAARALANENGAAKAATDGYEKLMQSIRARMTAADQQLKLGRDLTEAEKFEAKAKEELGKIADKLNGKKLSAAESEIAAVKARIELGEKAAVQREGDLKLAELIAGARQEELRGIEANTRAQEQATASTLQSLQDRLSGLREEEAVAELASQQNISLAEAIEKVAIARLREEQAKFNNIEGGRYQEIEREIAAREKLLPLLSTQALREREQRGWADMWSSIDRTAHDVWTNIWEGGDNVFKKLGQTLKATVLDVLYQLTVRPFIIQIGTSIFGSGFANAAQAATGGGSAISMLGGLGNIFTNGVNLLTKGVSTAFGDAFSTFATSDLGARLGLSSAVDYGTGYTANVVSPMGNTIGSGLGMLGNGMMGYGISSMLSGGYSTGGNTVNVLAGIASAFFGPLAGVVGGLINRLFGRKLADVGIEGTFGGEAGFDGQSYEFYKGGLLRSDKTKYSDLDPEFEKALGDTFKGMRAQVAFFADALGLSADKLEDYTSTIRFSTQGLNPEQIQEKFQEALATANNELAEQVLGTWTRTSKEVTRVVYDNAGRGADDYMASSREVTETIEESTYTASEYAKEGEKAIDTLTRLATSLTTVNSIWDTLGYTLLDASLAGADAASKIADAFGGLDKMISATGSYFQNFYSEEERRAVAARQLDKQLDDVGIADVPKTREEYRRLVEAQDLNTEAGRKAYAVLVMLSGVFAELTVTAEDAAEAARAEAKTKLDAAYSALERAIAAERKVLEVQRDAASELANLWGSIADIASSAMRDLRSEVASTAAMQAAQGMVYIEEALAGAQAGRLPDADGLSNALAAARGGLNPGNYASQFELDRDRLVLAGQMQQLAALAGKQKTTAELQLEALDRQIQQGEDTLDYWKQQIALATGTAETMLTIADAINAIRVLLTPAAAEGDADNPGGGASGGAVWGPGGSTAAKSSKYKKVVSLGSAGVGYQPVIDQATISKLDGLSALYHSFDGTGDLRGLFDAIKGAGGTLEDLHLLSGYYESDWEKAAASVGVPAFARGGMHQGGWALVGEEGPELAYMPPARIYSASATRGMQAGGNDAWASGMVEAVTTLATAVAGLSGEWNEVKGYLKTTARVLDDASEGPYLRMTPA